MKEIKISNGKWRLSFDKSEVITSPSGIIEGSKIVCSLSEFSKKKEEVEANGELIVDAGNTAQKCGLLPSDLLQQRDRCLMTLNNCRETIEMLQREIPGEQIVLRHEMTSRLRDIEAAIKSTEL